VALTRIWAAILAVLVTILVAGILLLSRSPAPDFDESDREALRVLAEAASVAMRAEIDGAPVSDAESLEGDPELQRALRQFDAGQLDSAGLNVQVAELAEQLRIRTGANLTVALINGRNEFDAANGIAEPLLGQIVASEPFTNAPSERATTFSITVGDKVYIAWVSVPNPAGRRWLAVDTLPMGAGSLLRRVLGAGTPAGLVQEGRLLGAVSGDQLVNAQLTELASEHLDDTPEQGSSRVFEIGSGSDRRIGALARVPGPAGNGSKGTAIAVLSRSTAAAVQSGNSLSALLRADPSAFIEQLNLPLLFGMALIGIAIAWLLPRFEMLGPLRALRQEFEGIAEGRQHQVFFDRYSGALGKCAEAAANAHEAIHRAYMTDVDLEGDEADARPTSTSKRMRVAGRTRGHRRLTTRSTAISTKAERSGLDPLPATESWKHPPAEPSRSGRLPRVRPTATSAFAGQTGHAADSSSAGRSSPRGELPSGNRFFPQRERSSADRPLPQRERSSADRPLPQRERSSSQRSFPPRGSSSTDPPLTERPTTANGHSKKPLVSGSHPVLAAKMGPPASSRPPSSVPWRTSGNQTVPGAKPPSKPTGAVPAMRNLTGARPPTPPPPPPGKLAAEIDHRKVYEQYLHARTSCGESNEGLSFERFVSRLKAHERQMRSKHPNSPGVEFIVYVKDGKAALKAKPKR
jgi:hypothetical protein